MGDADSEWVWVDGGGLGEQQWAAEPDELCAGVEWESGAGGEDGLGGGWLGGGCFSDGWTEKELEGKVLDEAATARTRAAVMEEFTNPTAQEDAEAGFVGRPVNGGARLVRANAPAKNAETPLDTMAGLLLGSPEFQRR